MSGIPRTERPRRRDGGLTWPLAILFIGVFGLLLGTWSGRQIGYYQGRAAVLAETNGECTK